MAKCLSVEQLLWTYVTIAMHKLWPSFPSCNELWKNEVFTLTPYFWSNVNSLWSDQQLSLKHKQIPSLFIRTSDLKILISPKLQTWNQLSHFQYKQTFRTVTTEPNTAKKFIESQNHCSFFLAWLTVAWKEEALWVALVTWCATETKISYNYSFDCVIVLLLFFSIWLGCRREVTSEALE